MKCKFCGKYEMREKEIGEKKFHGWYEIEIPIFHYWKWCKKHNNWCRNVAGSCGEIIRKAGNKIEVQVNEIF